MKKLISLMLSLVMVFAVAAPVISVIAADSEKYITVYLEGYGNWLYKNNDPNDEYIFPVEVDVGQRIKDALLPCLTELAGGLLTDNYDRYCDELYNAVAPIYDEVRVDPDGYVSDGSGWGGDMLKDSYSISYNKGFSGGYVHFKYDWRLPTEYNAEILSKFIDRVSADNSGAKVNIAGRCLGANIVSAYLQHAYEKAENGEVSNIDKINKVCLYAASTNGISAIGALFSGQIVLDGDAIENFADYYVNTQGLIEDPALASLVMAMIDLFNYAKVLGIGTDALMTIVNKVKDNIIPRLVRDTYGSFTSYWSMCPQEYTEAAIELCYNTPEIREEYAGTIEIIRSFRENVQLNAEETMTQLVEKYGLDIMVLAKYNFANLPLSADGNVQSDGFTEVYRASFGATAADLGKTLSDEYINAMTEEEKAFLSPDRKIDASTCLFPEKTWFIKNNHHNYFYDEMNYLIDAFFCGDDVTVFTNEQYPQFFEYSDEEEQFKVIEGLDDEEPEEGTNEERFSVLMRFLTAIMKFLTKLFNGNFDFNIGL